jgi:hypothetical protein
VEKQSLSVTSTTTNRTGELIRGNFYMESVIAYITGGADSINYCSYGFGLSNSSGVITTVATDTTQSKAGGFYTYPINTAYINTGQPIPLTIAYARTGSGAGQTLETLFKYRLIYQ